MSEYTVTSGIYWFHVVALDGNTGSTSLWAEGGCQVRVSIIQLDF